MNTANIASSVDISFVVKYMEWKFEKVSDELEAKFAPEFDEIKRALRAHGIMDEPEQSGVGMRTDFSYVPALPGFDISEIWGRRG